MSAGVIVEDAIVWEPDELYPGAQIARLDGWIAHVWPVDGGQYPYRSQIAGSHFEGTGFRVVAHFDHGAALRSAEKRLRKVVAS